MVRASPGQLTRAFISFAWLAAPGCGPNAQAGEDGVAASGAPATSAVVVVDVLPDDRRVAPAAASEGEVPPGMKLIPEGAFLMGGESEENTPRHEVIVARFYLDEAEVTMREYAACEAAGKCKTPRASNPFCNVNSKDHQEHPVNCIDWNDAQQFCAFVGKRLPTEREWEYAASGGKEQRRYAWGNDPPTRENSCYSHEGTCPVRSFAPGAFGLYDMTGNVWEWTSSWYGPYPEEASAGRARINRGGSWSRRFEKWMRNSLRGRFLPDEWSAAHGVRCAKHHQPVVCPPESTAKDAGCVRTSGSPLCPFGEAFAAGACRPGGIVPSWIAADGSMAPSLERGELPTALPTASAPPSIARSRSPGFDADCVRIAPSMPVSYELRGGHFHDREPLVRASGCKKRDVGPSWSSLCCPQ